MPIKQRDIYKYYNHNRTVLRFPDELNESINHIELSPKTRSIIFGYQYNESIDLITFPPNLQTIEFGNDFNQPIDKVKFPSKIISISFGCKFNQPIHKVIFPTSIESLSFGYLFDRPLNNLPINLKILTFRNISLENLTNLPPSLEKIIISFNSWHHMNCEYAKRIKLPYGCVIVNNNNEPLIQTT
ncbi:MAG: hypothetical protein Gaeavirus1_32 [Gaeavirus sp.]|uniref:FNIP repeat-containing protein n=1 Tax=Gaeavirus sp. TaxID=2487767 RepID=A0A3G4ZYA1_9VIRU|nr:MAG: hypothetical protein Gaeavirus1_32 [Gaeavirus sp.]